MLAFLRVTESAPLSWKPWQWGAIPVQTSTACCDEWFDDSGVAVHEITVPAVKNAIREGLKLVENPANAEKNLETIKTRISAEMVKKIALAFHD
jgi:hypothetical protein